MNCSLILKHGITFFLICDFNRSLNVKRLVYKCILGWCAGRKCVFPQRRGTYILFGEDMNMTKCDVF